MTTEQGLPADWPDPQGEWTDLPVEGCAHGRGISDEPATVEDVCMQITSRFSGRCANCGKPYLEGALIGYSDEAGGWVGSCCMEVER